MSVCGSNFYLDILRGSGGFCLHLLGLLFQRGPVLELTLEVHLAELHIVQILLMGPQGVVRPVLFELECVAFAVIGSTTRAVRKLNADGAQEMRRSDTHIFGDFNQLFLDVLGGP